MREGNLRSTPILNYISIGLQLFYYEEDKLDLMDQQQAWEFVKLLGVGVDILFAAYLIYFECSGLSQYLFPHPHQHQHLTDPLDPSGLIDDHHRLEHRYGGIEDIMEEERRVVITRDRKDSYCIQEKTPLLAIEDHEPVRQDISNIGKIDHHH